MQRWARLTTGLGRFLSKVQFNYRNGFKHTYLNMQERPQDYYFTHFVPYVVIAIENGYLGKSPWGNLPARPSLDSLLGMEGNRIKNVITYGADGSRYKLDDYMSIGFRKLSEGEKVAEIVLYEDGNIIPFSFDADFQGAMGVIAP